MNCNNQTSGVSDWGTDVQGALAEYAFSVWADLPWYAPRTINSFKEPDVGIFQVRCTKLDPYHHYLCIQKHDRDEDPYVLLRGSDFEWHVEGWMYGKDAKKDENIKQFKAHYKPCYAVHREKLNDLKSLKELIRVQKLGLTNSGNKALLASC